MRFIGLVEFFFFPKQKGSAEKSFKKTLYFTSLSIMILCRISCVADKYEK
jgi:hypothetical protein